MADQASGLLSPFLRRRRIAAALPFLRGRVLDYGCGVGALAKFFSPEFYAGVDDDAASLAIAKKEHPAHVFFSKEDFSLREGPFDSIALLAVIEHVDDGGSLFRFLGTLIAPDGCIVLTTPLPAAGPLHRLGARIGLFSKEAHEDHKSLYGRDEIASMARLIDFRIAIAKRFLFGMNQLFVLERK